MNTPYDVYFFDNFIERYALAKGKPVVLLRSYGWNHSTDVDAINASYAVYESILPTDMWTALKNSEYVFLEVEDLDDTLLYIIFSILDFVHFNSQTILFENIVVVFFILVNLNKIRAKDQR